MVGGPALVYVVLFAMLSAGPGNPQERNFSATSFRLDDGQFADCSLIVSTTRRLLP